jgi:lambda family phage portal protein
MVVGQGITRLVDHVIRGGMQLECVTGDDELNKELATRFNEWAGTPRQCDRQGRDSLTRMAKLAMRHVIVDGDISILPLQDGSLEFLEAHRLRTPKNTKKNVIHGVECDQCLRPERYWFTKEDVSTSVAVQKVGDTLQYEAWTKELEPNVLHLMDVRRKSQTRGVSAMAPIFNAIGMHDDIEFAKLVQAQIVSCFAIIRTRAEGAFNVDAPATGAVTTETQRDGTVRTLQGIAPGMEITGAEGEAISGFSPNTPNAEFFDHAMLILGFIAINLGIPLVVMLLDPRQSNFSSWRGAMDAAKPGFQRLIDMMVDGFYTPVYRWKVRQWLAEDPQLRAKAARAEINIFKHRWISPRIPYIEPNKDAQADISIVDGLLNSRREQLAGRGLDIDDIDRQIIDDNTRLIFSAAQAAKGLVEQGVEDVTWRDILRPVDVRRSLAMGDGGDGGEIPVRKSA